MSSILKCSTGKRVLDKCVFSLSPLCGAAFGASLHFEQNGTTQVIAAAAEAQSLDLPNALYDAGGLLVIPDMLDIASEPELLVRLSRLFGPKVDNYSHMTTREGTMSKSKRNCHVDVPEILLVSNVPPCNRRPPQLPNPPLTAEGNLPTQFPHRRGWHTDQSFRKIPPDVSLFYAVREAPRGQGQTLFADGSAAYNSLPSSLKESINNLHGIHAMPGAGRSERAVKSGEKPLFLDAHQLPKHHPIVRLHPVTGKRALYLCDTGQMDWVDGPFFGMKPGVKGDAARLLYQLMCHYTQPKYTYTHNWKRGDLIIYDNRSLAHSATWYDASKHERVMWRTTVSGNPGSAFTDGECSS